MHETYTLQVAVCEDNKDDAERLASFIKSSGIPAETACFSSGEGFLKNFVPGRFNLIFFDIFMKDINGIETAAQVREKDRFAVIVFTTTSPDFTRESYKLNALKYIDKPVNASDVRDALELALMKYKLRPSINITEAGGGKTVIYIDDIQYLELDDHVINVHLINRLLITSQAMRMDEIERQLPSPPFLRCHKSFLINLDHVSKIDKGKPGFLMKNGSYALIRKRDINKCGEYERSLFDWQLRKTINGSRE